MKGRSVLFFATRGRETRIQENPPFSPPPPVRVNLPSFRFHLVPPSSRALQAGSTPDTLLLPHSLSEVIHVLNFHQHKPPRVISDRLHRGAKRVPNPGLPHLQASGETKARTATRELLATINEKTSPHRIALKPRVVLYRRAMCLFIFSKPLWNSQTAACHVVHGVEIADSGGKVTTDKAPIDCGATSICLRQS